MQRRERKLRIRTLIGGMLALFTVPLLVVMVVSTYRQNDATARQNAEATMRHYSADAIGGMKAVFEPIKWSLRSAAMVGHQDSAFLHSDASFEYLLTLLRQSPTLISVYVGMPDGTFRQARIFEANKKLPDGTRPPPQTRFALRTVGPQPDGSIADRYQFIDYDGNPLGEKTFPSTYDPRLRGWYQQAAAKRDAMITDAEVFAADGLVGFTVAAPITTAGSAGGVVAGDLTLEGFGDFLRQRLVSPNAVGMILDAYGGTMATSALMQAYQASDGQVTLRHVSELNDPVVTLAYINRAQGSHEPYTFDYLGKSYIAEIEQMPPDFGKKWQFLTVAPLEDFTGNFAVNNRRLLIGGVIAIGLEILFIFAIAHLISRPLERLGQIIGRIDRLDSGASHLPKSLVREVSLLSGAVDTLGNTVRTFAAFVPVDLVRQLMAGGYELEIGGRSQFLSIMFTDLEAFSSLSEASPIQELFGRMSKYFEVVTKAINQEYGTVDKFIGDGAMAFWGAPQPLSDHARRACLAALVIEREMERLNAGWAEQDLKPLKIRIGIHSDAVLVGNFGSAERVSYTVMGGGVNIAARLEGVNKDYGTRICISHATYQEGGEQLCVRPITDVTVKGIRVKIPIYELMGAFGAARELEPDAATLRLSKLTWAAHDARIAGDIPKAISLYHDILAEYPQDRVAQAMLKHFDSVPSLPKPLAIETAS